MFKCNKVSVLIILVFVPQPVILVMVSQKLFCCLIKGENNQKKKEKTQKTKTLQSVPSSNAIQFD
jgi:hypothetical protein